jgi:hypothetical protein
MLRDERFGVGLVSSQPSRVGARKLACKASYDVGKFNVISNTLVSTLSLASSSSRHKPHLLLSHDNRLSVSHGYYFKHVSHYHV